MIDNIESCNQAIDNLIDDINKLQNGKKNMLNVIRQFVAVWDVESENKNCIIDKTWNCYIQASKILKENQ